MAWTAKVKFHSNPERIKVCLMHKDGINVLRLITVVANDVSDA